MAETLEITDEGFRTVGSHAGLAAASSSLPHGSYTTLRTYSGDRVLRLEQHVRRLEDSLPRRSPLEVDRVRAGLAAAIERTGFPESRLRLTFAPPSLFVSIERFSPLPERLYREGARCRSLGVKRENPHAKSTGFIATAGSAYASLPPGIEEGLMLSEDGAILEGLSSNFFGLRNGALYTEQERVLEGVTRAIVLEVAAGLVPLVRRPLRRDELEDTSECFLTSVSREILPVVEIDGRVVGSGAPGPTTQELMARFRTLVAREAVPVSARHAPR